jgi:erythrin-vacuolar iron transport family protein
MSIRLDFATLSLMDALDLAVLVELEAYQRYKMFAAQIGHRGPGDTASVFTMMAENEAKHGQQLEARRKASFGVTPCRVTLDDLFDVEAPEMGAPRRTMSTLQAFELALSSEQKAYDFYTEALDHITDADVRKLFSELLDEETEHVRMVRETIARLPPSANIEFELDLDESPSL